MLCNTFPSALPGGNSDADMHHSAIVDCIWVKNQQIYYILDVLYWGILPFTNCEVTYKYTHNILYTYIYFKNLYQLPYKK